MITDERVEIRIQAVESMQIYIAKSEYFADFGPSKK